MLVSFDDTDDAGGGCTTAVVLAVLAAAPHLALRGMPRLVRLNPNVPYKTRGNAAVCLELVHPEGPQVQVGWWGGHVVHARPEGRPAQVAPGVLEAVLRAARPEASPGAALWHAPPPPAAYWQAVRTRLEPDEAEPLLATAHATAGGRGRVGALAAAAWPGPPTSYELIVYRRLDRIGRPRDVQADLADLDARGVTFHSYDPEEQVAACVPSTPCPVLCGLRGLDPERLVEEALPALEPGLGEAPAGWFLFATNQGSGDHVTPVEHVGEVPEWGSLAMDATVREVPKDLRGGHVCVMLDDPRGNGLSAVAFEPTKSFRRVLRALRPGDRVHVVGAWADGSVRLEKLRVDALAPQQVKVENPRCPRCRRRMKSRGRQAGYRCPDGHGSAPEDAARRTVEPRTLRTGWYEVPVMARRHLHRPVLFDALPRS